MRMKLKSIRIQGMHNVVDKTYHLGDMNYFVGPNGAGKSTVMQAIQLALLGYIPGTDKKKSAIFQHSNGRFMAVNLILGHDDNDITVINRSWTRKGKEIVATVETIPAGVEIENIINDISLPILNFNEFISMTSNKLKDWFINFLPDSEISIDWEQKLRQEIIEYGTLLNPNIVPETVLYVTSLHSTGLDQIREFNTYLKQQQSFKKSELTRIQGTIQSLIFYDDCDDSTDVNVLKDQNKQDSLIRDNINYQLGIITQNKKIEAQLKTLTDVTSDSLESDERYNDTCAKLNEARVMISRYDVDVAEYANRIAALKQQHIDKMAVVNKGGVCPYSGSVCDSIKQMLDVFVDDVKKIDTEIAELETVRSRVQYNRTTVAAQVHTLEQIKATISSQYNQYDSLKQQYNSSVKGLDENVLRKKLQDLTDSIETRHNLIIKLESNKQYNELMQTLTTQKFQTEQEIEIFKAWVKLTDVNGMQSNIMKAPFDTLADRISVYLNKFFNRTDLSAAFHLTQEANSFSFGIYTAENAYIEFDLLSSGEKCLYTLALMLSIIESSNTDLPIILIDDLLDHLDADRVVTCFETLYNITSVQILLAGVQQAPTADGVIEV